MGWQSGLCPLESCCHWRLFARYPVAERADVVEPRDEPEREQEQSRVERARGAVVEARDDPPKRRARRGRTEGNADDEPDCGADHEVTRPMQSYVEPRQADER